MLRNLPIRLVLILLVAPAGAGAQTKWDATAVAGMFAGHLPQPGPQRYQEDWLETAQGGVVLGRYLTPSLKIEFEGTVTGDGTQYITQLVTAPGLPTPFHVSSEAHYAVRSLATALTWQFFENEWVHPFVQAGVSADVDRRSVHTWPQRYYNRDPVTGIVTIDVDLPGGVDGPHTTTTARPLVGGGVKVYASPRLFVRADGRVSFGQARQHVVFRIGFGADF